MKENRGLTLVELLVTVAILSVVLLVATSFMTTGSRTFARGSADAQVQKEAELAVNQMEDMIIDVNGGVDLVEDSTTGDSELILYNAGGDSGVVEYTKESIIYKKADQKIYCSKWNMTYDTATNSYAVDSEQYTDQLLAENVTDFKADISDVYTDTASDGSTIDIVKSVQIKVGYDDGTGKAAYATSPIITLRNRMMKSDNPTAIFDNTPVETDTLSLYISDQGSSDVKPIQDRVTTVTRGNVYNIYAMINTGANVNSLVDWEIAESNSLSTINSSGLLSVGTYEPNEYLTITAKYKSNPNKKVTGVVKVIGGTGEGGIKSLNGVSIFAKSLYPFEPKYGSIVSTTGFETADYSNLEYKWSVSDMTRVESFADSTDSMATDSLSPVIKREADSYGKQIVITLEVTWHIDENTTQTVSDSTVYWIDWEGTEGGDSNMERGRTETDENSNDHGKNYYKFVHPEYESVEVTSDFYFCDENGNYISELDKYKSYVELELKGTPPDTYYLTFTKDLPPDRPYYIKVIIYFDDLKYENDWRYERIHYIQQLQLYGETTHISGTANLYDQYAAFYVNYAIVGYYNNAWVGALPMDYEVTINGTIPAEVTIGATCSKTVTNGSTENGLRAEFGFVVDAGDKEIWQIQNETDIKSITVKISYRDYPSIYTYSTVIFDH